MVVQNSIATVWLMQVGGRKDKTIDFCVQTTRIKRISCRGKGGTDCAIVSLGLVACLQNRAGHPENEHGNDYKLFRLAWRKIWAVSMFDLAV